MVISINTEREKIFLKDVKTKKMAFKQDKLMIELSKQHMAFCM